VPVERENGEDDSSAEGRKFFLGATSPSAARRAVRRRWVAMKQFLPWRPVHDDPECIEDARDQREDPLLQDEGMAIAVQRDGDQIPVVIEEILAIDHSRLPTELSDRSYGDHPHGDEQCTVRCEECLRPPAHDLIEPRSFGASPEQKDRAQMYYEDAGE
jgi:hypothetical protein